MKGMKSQTFDDSEKPEEGELILEDEKAKGEAIAGGTLQ